MFSKRLLTGYSYPTLMPAPIRLRSASRSKLSKFLPPSIRGNEDRASWTGFRQFPASFAPFNYNHATANKRVSLSVSLPESPLLGYRLPIGSFIMIRRDYSRRNAGNNWRFVPRSCSSSESRAIARYPDMPRRKSRDPSLKRQPICMEIRVAICCGNSAADLRLIRYESRACDREKRQGRGGGGGRAEGRDGREKEGKGTFLPRDDAGFANPRTFELALQRGAVMSGAGRKGAPELKAR